MLFQKLEGSSQNLDADSTLEDLPRDEQEMHACKNFRIFTFLQGQCLSLFSHIRIIKHGTAGRLATLLQSFSIELYSLLSITENDKWQNITLGYCWIRCCPLTNMSLCTEGSYVCVIIVNVMQQYKCTIPVLYLVLRWRNHNGFLKLLTPLCSHNIIIQSKSSFS